PPRLTFPRHSTLIPPCIPPQQTFSTLLINLSCYALNQDIAGTGAVDAQETPCGV
ncbi:hypothetical protein K443DRAFT_77681, partial [Laccaria amethystina LaAM-08-1]